MIFFHFVDEYFAVINSGIEGILYTLFFLPSPVIQTDFVTTTVIYVVIDGLYIVHWIYQLTTEPDIHQAPVFDHFTCKTMSIH